ncbi:RimJ/RimL family protein N-acetyltransferase [Lutibacter sp. Hel_I_33_5]|uniref:GNAT family N-acetyltransferase n=1 Tax=Lutibacter sp. Hel_I_33_5 TaxID=1566289 RepID=UPI0011ADEBBB|nr:GNAT family N-acetyltransferase [Lutibacter sp. Hel_I_33_5]TVZ55122.1 RimJ/RimL family protein N-acetyltransferase [Lutibacter sp. Hel_I_33_5]
MIFETERLLVRKLVLEDAQPFYELESNPKVLQYATGDVKNEAACFNELQELIAKYEKPTNDFWIYAVIRKSDLNFVGTVALVKDDEDDEIGYRFLEKFWENGYGFEVCEELINYCKQIKINKLIAYVVDENVASTKIIERLKFKSVRQFISDDIKLPETKYELYL